MEGGEFNSIYKKICLYDYDVDHVEFECGNMLQYYTLKYFHTVRAIIFIHKIRNIFIILKIIEFMNKIVMLSTLGILASILALGTTSITNQVYAQFNESQPETIEELEEILGNNTEIMEENTPISNPNNTILDATEVNIEEDCMILADGSEYCP
ncbi:MAG: hypothetical protein ACPKQO_00335 [Nitrososphaeraceae archaeon]